MDQGSGGALLKTDESDVENKPYLRKYTKTFPNTDTGKSFRFRLEAFNAVGSVLSPIASTVLARAPTTPTTGPTLIKANTNAYQIGIDWAEVTDTGGSKITSYELQMSLPQSDNFISIVGFTRPYLDTEGVFLIGTETQISDVAIMLNITLGIDHKFRYRARNAAGWSGFSPISFLRADTIPDSPEKPMLTAHSSTSLKVALQRRTSVLKLYIGKPGDAFADFTLVTEYDGEALEYTFDITDTPAYIETGKIYRIACIATNEFGDSEFTTELTVGVGDKPPAPTNFVQAALTSDPSTITVKWDKVTVSDLPILGYIVSMDDGLGGDFRTVYDGSTNPQVTYYTAENLEPGREYIFKVQAVDINGSGTETNLDVFACVAPSGLERPSIKDIVGASYTVRWNSPLNDGGCAVTSITIYRDDGEGGEITTEVQKVTDGSLRYTDTLNLATDRGKTFRIAVEADNGIGKVSSSATSFVLAELPAIPTPKPTVDSVYTNTQQIKVLFENTNTDTGGAALKEYCLQMDDGLGGEFTTVFCSTHQTSYTTTNVVRGRVYRFKYRVRNAAGWSAYSETAYITPSTKPEAPPKPKFVSGTDTQIVLSFEESVDDNGVAIDHYQLEIDEGDDLTSNFVVVTRYSGSALSFTLDSVLDSLDAPGTLYRVRLAAVNKDGVFSDYSDVLLVALGSLPSKPNTPTKDISRSSTNSILVQWDEITGDTLTIQGYKLYADSGRADGFKLVFDGSNSPGIREYLLQNTNVDLTYRFRVQATNINGDGPFSNIASLVSCTTPSSFSAPTVIEVTQTHATISWGEPSGKGGCPITGYGIFWAPQGGSFTEYDPTNVNHKPFLTRYTLDLSSQTVGGIYQVYVSASNRAGSTSSDTVSFILASTPGKPALATSESDGKYLKVIMSAPSNGGSSIVTYQLQVDFDDRKGFVTVSGGDSKHTLTLDYTISSEALTTGDRYRARYRAKNKVGWGEWSDIAYLLVAGAPSTPPAPRLVSASAGNIRIYISSVDSDNGSPIKNYHVYIDSGDYSSEVTTKHGSSSTGEVEYTITGLTPGAIYRVGIIAENEALSSPMSAYGIFAASDPPAAPASLTKDMNASTLTSIVLNWSKVEEADKAIYGYIVTMAKAGSSNFEIVYDGTDRPQVRR